MTMRSILPLTVLALGLTAAPAQATLLVRSDSTGLTVADQNGLDDTVRVTGGTQNGNPVYVVQNLNAGDVFKFDRRDNCSAGSTGDTAVCKRFSGKLNLNVASGDDDLRVTNSGADRASVNLGSGEDRYVGLGGTDNVFMGSGGGEVETLGGADDITPGDGEDDIEAGSGADSVSGGGSTHRGRDRYTMGSGSDTVSAFSEPEGVSAVGGSGNDNLHTGFGDDTVEGGPGQDILNSGPDDDTVYAKEIVAPAEVDDVQCSLGFDTVSADSQDVVDATSNPGGGTCEQVERSPVGEAPHVVIGPKTLRVARSGRTRVRLRCHRRTRKLGCRGSLRLSIARRRKGGVQSSRSRRVRYRIRAGKRKTVKLRLSRRDVRALRGRQRRGKVTRGILVSVERGRRGDKLTVKNPRLRLR